MDQQLKILVAEDNPDDVSLLQRAFSRAGVEIPIHFVEDGQEAIDYLQEGSPLKQTRTHDPPAMLLLDLKMPRMDGFEVLAWLRQHPEFHDMRVVIFSSSDQPQDMSHAQELGATSYLVKPSASQDYIKVVKDLENHLIQISLVNDLGPH